MPDYYTREMRERGRREYHRVTSEKCNTIAAYVCLAVIVMVFFTYFY